MASFDKLKLQGIRSIGAEEKHVQVVEFDKPLTLIAGQNGSGKTTLIEALKYVTTGELPSGKLGAFIHDPKVSSRTRTDGLVKLEFRDYRGRPCIATRRFTAIVKNKTVKCTSEEATIKLFNESSQEWTSVSSKQIDFATEMSNLLNVPKAILDYVVFCHQDESNWPLSGTNKDLKTKFDAIFQADRYVKAVEHLTKLRKEYGNDLKTVQIHLDHSKEILSDKHDMMAKLLREKKALRANEAESAVLTNQLAPLDSSLSAIIDELKSVHDKTKSLDSLRVRHSEVVKSMRAIDVAPYNGSLDDILLEITELDNSGRNSIIEQNRLRDELDQLNKQMMIRQLDRQTLGKRQGSLEHSVQERDKMSENRRKMVADCANKYDITEQQILGQKDDNESILDFWKLFEKKRKAGNEKYLHTVQEFENRLNDLQRKQRMTEVERGKLETSIEAKKDTGRRHDEAAIEAADNLRRISRSQSRMSQVLREINEVEEQIGVFDSGSQVESVIERLRAEIGQLKDKLDRLLNERKVAEEYQSLMSNLSYKRKDREQRLTECERTLNPHTQTLLDFFGSIPQAFIRDTIRDKLDEVNREISQLEEEKSQKDSLVGDLNRKLEGVQLKVDQSEDSSCLLARQIRAVIKGENLSEKIAQTEKELSELRLDKSVVDGGKHVYEKFIEQTERGRCCPLCDRNYSDQIDVDNLLNKLKRKVNVLPKESLECGRKLEEKEELREKLVDVRRMVEQRRQLHEEQIPKLKEEVKVLTGQYSDAQAQLGLTITELKSAEDRHKRLRSVESDSSLIDSTRRGVVDLDRQILVLEKQMPQQERNAMRTLEQIDIDFDCTKKELNIVEKDVEGRQNEMKRINQLNRNLNTLIGEKNCLAGSEHEIEALKGRQAENEQLAAKYRQESEKAALALPALTQRINEIVEEIRQTKRELLAYKGTMDEKLAKMSSDSAQLKAINDNLIESIDYSHDLQNCLVRLEKIDKEMAEAVDRRAQVEVQLQSVNAEVTNREGRKLKLANQRQLIELEMTRKELNVQIAEKETAFGGLTLNEIEKQRVQLVGETDKLRKEIHTLDGEMKRLREVIAETEVQLAKPKFRDAEKAVYEHKVDKVTLDETIKDLHRYGTALDRAIVDYHSSKMDEINDRLEEYWRKIYQTDDVDSIRIKSEGISATEKKRTYDYKVVMVLDYREYDMRDRCSAGQKVLASILIRLALADVFCNSCAMIALDEPTTNLDIRKVDNLADKLDEIIHIRSEQSNFQMVIISHDERLIDLLYRAHPSRYILGVSKEMGLTDSREYTVVHKYDSFDRFQDQRRLH